MWLLRDRFRFEFLLGVSPHEGVVFDLEVFPDFLCQDIRSNVFLSLQCEPAVAMVTVNRHCVWMAVWMSDLVEGAKDNWFEEILWPERSNAERMDDILGNKRGSELWPECQEKDVGLTEFFKAVFP